MSSIDRRLGDGWSAEGDEADADAFVLGKVKAEGIAGGDASGDDGASGDNGGGASFTTPAAGRLNRFVGGALGSLGRGSTDIGRTGRGMASGVEGSGFAGSGTGAGALASTTGSDDLGATSFCLAGDISSAIAAVGFAG